VKDTKATTYPSHTASLRDTDSKFK